MYAIEPFLPLRFVLINGQSAKVPHFLVQTLRQHPHLSPRLLLSSRSSQRSPLQAQGLWLSGTLQCLHQHGFQYQTLSLHLSHTLPHTVQDPILTLPHTCQSLFRKIPHSSSAGWQPNEESAIAVYWGGIRELGNRNFLSAFTPRMRTQHF